MGSEGTGMMGAAEVEDARSARQWWTLSDVRDALAEAAERLDRHVRGGKYPFAGDGPWALVIRDNRSAGPGERDGHAPDYVEPLRDQQVRRLVPLRAAEIAEMERVLGWVEWLPEGDDLRRLVGTVSLLIGAQGRHVDWREVKRRMRSERSADALRMRYSRALTVICARLNRRVGGALRV